jgi:hypothetical protein
MRVMDGACVRSVLMRNVTAAYQSEVSDIATGYVTKLNFWELRYLYAFERSRGAAEFISPSA